jgi:hypothetical protein
MYNYLTNYLTHVYYFITCTVHLLLFCTMTNKCTIISQIISLLCIILLHVPFNCYYFVLWATNVQLSHKLSHSYYFIKCTVHLLLFFTMTNQCTIIWQIITLLSIILIHVPCIYYFCCDQQMHNYLPSYLIICEIIVDLLVIVQSIKRSTVRVLNYLYARYKNQPVNAGQLHNFSLLCERCETHKYTVLGGGGGDADGGACNRCCALKCYSLTYPGTLVTVSVKLNEKHHAGLVSNYLE